MTGKDYSAYKFIPKMRLFMSIDQIGATKAKFSNSILPLKEDSNQELIFPVWHNKLLTFHNEFDKIFKYRIWARKFRNSQNPPKIWKRLGDEIIYTVELKDAIDAVRSIAAMLLAIRQYRSENGIDCDTYDKPYKMDRVDTKNSFALNIKATFWLAGFPLINMEIPKQSQSNLLGGNRPYNPTLINQVSVVKAKSEIDFVGPSIDTGFRLAGKSDKNRIALSIDLALLLAKVFGAPCRNEEVNEINDILSEAALYPVETKLLSQNMYFEGNHELKGVYSNDYNYPVFCLRSPYDQYNKGPNDFFHEISTPESVEFKCEEFIKSMGDYALFPYIPGCDFLGTAPKFYDEYITMWNRFIRDECGVADDSNKAKGEVEQGPQKGPQKESHALDGKSIGTIRNRFVSTKRNNPNSNQGADA